MNIKSIIPLLKQKVSSGGRASRIEASMMLAVIAFKGKKRIGNQCPASAHSLRVGLQLERFGESAHVVVGGNCHDLWEDTEVTKEQLIAIFGEPVWQLVLACSHDESLYESDNRLGNEDLFRRAELEGRDAIAIKVVDVTDNLYTFEDLKVDWQEEMLYCGRTWLQLGERFLGENAPHCVELRHQLHRISSKRQNHAV